MPRNYLFTKEEIRAAALELTREKGFAAVTARSLGKKLGTTSRPIFSHYANMADVQKGIIDSAQELYQSYIQREVENGKYPTYKASGMAYIRFAREEKNLFKLLFMRDRSREKIKENPKEKDLLTELIVNQVGIDRNSATTFYLEMWAYTHGIATMIATDYLTWDEELSSRALTDVYEGLKSRYGGFYAEKTSAEKPSIEQNPKSSAESNAESTSKNFNKSSNDKPDESPNETANEKTDGNPKDETCEKKDDKSQNNSVIETERLFMRRITREDFSALCRTLKDETAMRAYEGAFSDEEVKEWIDRQIARYKEYEFGLWAVILKETGELIGQCGLTMQPWKDKSVLEIGYLFERKQWHKGYATEAARACKKYAFENLKSDAVCSIIRDTNVASQNVALRNGMKKKDEWVKRYKGVDMPHYRFIVTRKEYEKDKE